VNGGLSIGGWRIEPLKAEHNRAAFTCGDSVLDKYIQEYATQDSRRFLAACFVLLPEGSDTVAGFYTLAASSLSLDVLPPALIRKLPKYPAVPATLLGRLAVAAAHQRNRLGEVLLLDALKRSLQMTDQIASHLFVVDANGDRAKMFYLRYGFLELPTISNRLFLPMKSIRQLLDRRGKQ
jgi:ribosomal protein S18 acetylase RimI-like enzyme